MNNFTDLFQSLAIIANGVAIILLSRRFGGRS